MSDTPKTDISEQAATASLSKAGLFSAGFCRVLDMADLERENADLRAKLDEAQQNKTDAAKANQSLNKCAMEFEQQSEYWQRRSEQYQREKALLRRQLTEAERKLATARAEVLEKAAVIAWSYFMNLAQKRRVNPSTMNDEFEVCAAIRAAKEGE